MQNDSLQSSHYIHRLGLDGEFSLWFFDLIFFWSEKAQKPRSIKTICRKESVLTDNSLLNFCKLGA